MNKSQLKNVSVSHATMNPKHLIPAFLDFYESVTGRKPRILGLTDYVNNLPGLTDKDQENECWILDELFDKLDTLSPSGFYFGSHPGDGADYGFWKCEKY